MTSRIRKELELAGRRPQRLLPRRVPAQERSRALVDSIVEAGCRVLATKGWEAFSMQAAAGTAGVSPGSLYQYFPSKDALVAEIIERESAREMASYLDAFCSIPPDASIFVVLDGVVRTVLAYQRERADLMRQAVAAVPHLGRFPALGNRARAVVDFLRGRLEAHARSLPGVDPALAAHVLANAIHSLTHDGVLARPEGLDDETLAREISILVRGYLLGNRE